MKTNRWTTKAQQITAIGAALDVSGGNTIFSITGSSGSRTITSLSGGGAGQWVILLFGDSNVTVTTAAATLKGNVNFAGANGDTLWLATADGTNWREVARQEVAGTTGPISASTITASGAAALNGGITVDSTAFTVADTSGNVATTGTLTVGGAAALNGGITVDSTAFTVADTSGNTAIAGTLGVTGVTTPTGGVAAAGGFSFSPRLITTGGLPPAASTAGTDATPVNTEVYIGEIFIPANTTVTGVAIMNGSAVAGNLKVGLADSAGAVVATSASTAQSGTDTLQRVDFTGTYAAKGPATYYVLAMFDTNTTPRFNAHPFGNFGAAKQTGQVFATGFTTITPPTTFTADLAPIAGLY